MTWEERVLLDAVVEGTKSTSALQELYWPGLHAYLSPFVDDEHTQLLVESVVFQLLKELYIQTRATKGRGQLNYRLLREPLSETLKRLTEMAMVYLLNKSDEIDQSIRQGLTKLMITLVPLLVPQIDSQTSVAAVSATLIVLDSRHQDYWPELPSEEILLGKGLRFDPVKQFSYLRDRLTEQLLLIRVRERDKTAIEQITEFAWLGDKKARQLKEQFTDTIQIAIRRVVKREFDANRLTRDTSFIQSATRYVWDKLLLGDDETTVPHLQTKAVTSSLMTCIQKLAFDRRGRQIMGKLPNFLTAKSTQEEFNYTITKHTGESGVSTEMSSLITFHSNEYQIEDPAIQDLMIESDPIGDPTYLFDEKDAVKKAFMGLGDSNNSEITLKNCRWMLLYHQKALDHLAILSDDSAFIGYLDETYRKRKEEEWPLDGREAPDEDVNWFKNFNVQCSNCYRKFLENLQKDQRWSR